MLLTIGSVCSRLSSCRIESYKYVGDSFGLFAAVGLQGVMYVDRYMQAAIYSPYIVHKAYWYSFHETIDESFCTDRVLLYNVTCAGFMDIRQVNMRQTCGV